VLGITAITPKFVTSWSHNGCCASGLIPTFQAEGKQKKEGKKVIRTIIFLPETFSLFLIGQNSMANLSFKDYDEDHLFLVQHTVTLKTNEGSAGQQKGRIDLRQFWLKDMNLKISNHLLTTTPSPLSAAVDSKPNWANNLELNS
jgi:hypothetical protein